MANAAVLGAQPLGQIGGPFYRGKLAVARFYAKAVLPGIGLARRLVEASDLDLMALPDDSW